MLMNMALPSNYKQIAVGALTGPVTPLPSGGVEAAVAVAAAGRVHPAAVEAAIAIRTRRQYLRTAIMAIQRLRHRK